MKKEKKGFTLVKVLEDCNISNMSLESLTKAEVKGWFNVVRVQLPFFKSNQLLQYD
jgi:hypothetical protein